MIFRIWCSVSIYNNYKFSIATIKVVSIIIVTRTTFIVSIETYFSKVAGLQCVTKGLYCSKCITMSFLESFRTAF